MSNTSPQAVDQYLSLLTKADGERACRQLRHLMEFIYEGIDFKGKRVLDIGGGTGRHSFYALAQGAASATIIEPEGDGGEATMIATFKGWKEALGNPNVTLIQTTFQEYSPPEEGFDIVLSQDSVNHFDEPACITLRTSAQSRETYDNIFRKIASVTSPGGLLVLTDCSSSNLFPCLGFRNPFDPAIEWNKHQPPSVWSALAREHGFTQTSLRWSSPSRLGSVGLTLLSSAVAAWFFTSHFVMTFRKS